MAAAAPQATRGTTAARGKSARRKTSRKKANGKTARSATYYVGHVPLRVIRDGEDVQVAVGQEIPEAADFKNLGLYIRKGLVLCVDADGVAPPESESMLRLLEIPFKSRAEKLFEERAAREAANAANTRHNPPPPRGGTRRAHTPGRAASGLRERSAAQTGAPAEVNGGDNRERSGEGGRRRRRRKKTTSRKKATRKRAAGKSTRKRS